MKYRVFGTVEAVVSVIVEAKTEEEAIDAANDMVNNGEFDVMQYCGNGGCDKLIGVEADGATIDCTDRVFFDDACVQ